MKAVVAAAVLTATTALAPHDPITTRVTWDREIAPIIQARCVSCHSPGGRAPMPLVTYEQARPWARAIREEVLARRMPKWHVARGYGDFTNDPSLSAFEIALITAWADGGAPRTAPNPRSAERAPAQPSPPGPDRPERASAAVSVACTPQPLPAGRLVAIRPSLAAGGSLDLALHFPDGSAEPLISVRDFDPLFEETYWLRVPASMPDGTGLTVRGLPGHDCRLVLFVAPK